MSKQTLSSLVGAVRDDVSAISNDITALAKAELGRDGKRIGFGLAAFIVALALAPLILILLAITVAEALVAAGLARWAAYLADAGIVLVVVAALAALGAVLFKKVKGPQRTVTAVKDTLAALGGKTPEEAAAARAANQTAVPPAGPAIHTPAA
jgi:hypothetical protein